MIAAKRRMKARERNPRESLQKPVNLSVAETSQLLARVV
jgi:hypothetical protein